jgi:hypothetical protein
MKSMKNTLFTAIDCLLRLDNFRKTNMRKYIPWLLLIMISFVGKYVGMRETTTTVAMIPSPRYTQKNSLKTDILPNFKSSALVHQIILGSVE